MGNKPDKRSKEDQEAMSKYLSEKFVELAKGQELIPVILDRASWEMLQYSITQALKTKHKEKKWARN